MPFAPRTALITFCTLVLPACVPSIVVGDNPQDSDPAPGTSETPPSTGTATTSTPTTSAGPTTTTSATDPSSTSDPDTSTASTAITATTADTADTTVTSTTTDAASTAATATNTDSTPSTSDVSTTTDSSEGTTMGPRPLPGLEGFAGCPLDAPPGTMVQGPSVFGQFTAQRAYFAWLAATTPYSPRLVLLSPEADAATELADSDPTGNSGLVMAHWVDSESILEEGWIGTWETTATIHDKGMTGFPPEPDAVKITELAGNWDAFDPADPPRIVGTVEGAISGPFDAVFCDKLIAIIIPE
ncbi:hypothetical protein SAMN02745121_05962 [Nannocystis exedens]|uniref:Uncharacterized protein n=1 Tax=Nannocystis exedens TaxID=54 RepID=A0A1I2E9Y8_9BACT|nr:hypothetical protein [Nannocystis exedens]PCC74859.1 hypothetical protein NAEX_07959 [Nannocystis exedens]SFE89665.1 hypothetical protein SAMN02745121_05962 [Nannocystis exedens]